MDRPAPGKVRIEDAAVTLFAEKGVKETTIADIAQRAGLSEGALYRHYKGKAELVERLFSEHYRTLGQQLDALQAAETTGRAKLAAMIEAVCALFENDQALFRLLLLVQHEQLPRLSPGLRSPVQVVSDVLSGAMSRGEIPGQDPNFATALVFGIVLQTATFRIYDRLDRPMTDLSTRLTAACWAALRAEPVE